MIISVASGKGGTGKTTVSTNLSYVLSKNYKTLLLDCDVEAPNSHIFIKPKELKSENVTVLVPHIDMGKCNFCGKCVEVCAFNVFCNLKNDILIFRELCHGCGACRHFCPQGAITEKKEKIGMIEYGQVSSNFDFAHGRLDIGKPMVPPIISKVKEQIKNDKNYDYCIIDSPPGTSCPVVTAVNGSDYCILVTEPTPFGFYDLKLAIDVVKQLEIPFGVIINKADMGNDDVYDYCLKNKISVLLEIPFDREIAKTYSEGSLIADRFPEYQGKFLNVLHSIRENHKR